MGNLNQVFAIEPEQKARSKQTHLGKSMDDWANTHRPVLPEVFDNIAPQTLSLAHYIMAHTLLDAGSVIADIGCGNGEVTYAMAALYPHLKFIGVDMDSKAIQHAWNNYKMPNLSYRNGDVFQKVFEPESMDAIINANFLNRIYSSRRYNTNFVRRALRNQMDMLKTGGSLVIHDHMMPNKSDFVLMELPDQSSSGSQIMEMSEADLLEHYSKTARPQENIGCNGFFLEELPPRTPQTRLFRLAHKWAIEFILRKDQRPDWDSLLKREYTFYTEDDFQETINELGGRVLYAAPHRNTCFLKKNYDGRVRLYNDEGTPLAPPSTSFILLAQKSREGQSLVLKERRPAEEKLQNIHISTVRDKATGQMIDLVHPSQSMSEVMPYYVSPEGQLYIYLAQNVSRGVVNAVQRIGENIDGKFWSGHMTEAISINNENFELLDQDNQPAVKNFISDWTGLDTYKNSMLEKGPSIYPAPDFIDDVISCHYVRVNRPDGTIHPHHQTPVGGGFMDIAQIRELNAQDVLRAIHVGRLPNSRLEIQIMALMNHLKIAVDEWIVDELPIDNTPPEKSITIDELMKLKEESGKQDKRFKEFAAPTGKIRTVNSLFVDEGNIDGGMTGLASRNMEFVVPDDETTNVAVVLPLTRDLSGEVMACIETKFLPVPERHKGNGMSISVPSFRLPKSVRSFEQAKKYVAEQFDVPADRVGKLGESYFSHVGVTPQRIYPFVVASAARDKGGYDGGERIHAPLADLFHLLTYMEHDWNGNLLWTVTMANTYMCGQGMVTGENHTPSNSKLEKKTIKAPDVELPPIFRT